jgi:hypothetical protein
MRDWDLELRSGQAACDGRIDIADNDDEIGPFFEKDFFKLDHYAGGLLRVRSRPDSKINVRLRELKIVEEHLRHIFIVMLAGVDDEVPYAFYIPEGPVKRRYFHEIRARTDNTYELQIPAHFPSPSRTIFSLPFLTFLVAFLASNTHFEFLTTDS